MKRLEVKAGTLEYSDGFMGFKPIPCRLVVSVVCNVSGLTASLVFLQLYNTMLVTDKASKPVVNLFIKRGLSESNY